MMIIITIATYLERIEENIMRACERLPVLAETGIKRNINGPITYSADGLPLIGKIPGVDNAYACLGLRAGIGEGGGHGKLLAEIIVHGEAEWDTWALDPRRFTGHADIEYTTAIAIEDYQNEFRFHMPDEHRPAGRPAKTTSLYPVLKDAHAEFGVINGWERALYYRPDDPVFSLGLLIDEQGDDRYSTGLENGETRFEDKTNAPKGRGMAGVARDLD